MKATKSTLSLINKTSSKLSPHLLFRPSPFSSCTHLVTTSTVNAGNSFIPFESLKKQNRYFFLSQKNLQEQEGNKQDTEKTQEKQENEEKKEQQQQQQQQEQEQEKREKNTKTEQKKQQEPQKSEQELKMEKLEYEIIEKDKKIKDIEEKWAIALRENELVRRIARSDVEKASKYAISNFAKELLNVADNLKRAISTTNKPEIQELLSDDSTMSKNLKSIFQGVQMTQSILLKAFNLNGITPYETNVGDKFDPEFHDALARQPIDANHPNAKPNTIAFIIYDGYKINERILRPAVVSVYVDESGEIDSSPSSESSQETSQQESQQQDTAEGESKEEKSEK